jgi:hypothetical protein
VTRFAGLSLLVLLPASGAAGTAAAEEPVPFSTLVTPEDSTETNACASGAFNGLGTPGREWELRSDTAFGTTRILTQHFALGHVFPIGEKERFGVAAHVEFGGDDDTLTGLYSLRRPIVSLGLWARSKDAAYVAEAGVRLIPNTGIPSDSDPQALRLALDATYASAIADDAQWLTFDRWGYQVYGQIQSRTTPFLVRVPWSALTLGTFMLGARYGGEISLEPLSVRTWLGPQQGVIGNVFLDVFLDMPRLLESTANLQLGIHFEASLSSVWPGSEPLPIVCTTYLGWSPASWVSARIFWPSTSPHTGKRDRDGNPRIFFE